MALTRINPADQIGKSAGYPGVLTTDNSNEAYWLAPPTAGSYYLLGHDPSKVLDWLGIGEGLDIVDGALIATGIDVAYTQILDEGEVVNNTNTIIDIVGAGIVANDQGAGVTRIGLDATLNALAGFNANGFMVQISTDNFLSRQLEGVPGRIDISMPDGVSGNPIIDVDPNFASIDLADGDNIALLNADQIFTGDNTFNTNVVMNDTPTLDNHLVPKWYIDGLLIGQRRSSVTLSTEDDIVLSGEQIIDGELTSSTRVLVRKQIAEKQNGIYISSAGAWTRASDMNAAGEVDGTMVIIEDGSQQGEIWYTVSEVTTLDSDPIVWTKLATGVIDGIGDPETIAFWFDFNTLTKSDTFRFKDNQMAIGLTLYFANTVLSTKGTSTSNGEFAWRHYDSANNYTFTVANNGEVVIGDGNNLTINKLGITATTAAADFFIESTNESLKLITPDGFPIVMQGGTDLSNAPSTLFNATRNSTTFEQYNVQIPGLFNPAGVGTNAYIDLLIAPTIDQDGGHTGITYGAKIAPILLSAVDFRGVDITAPGQTALRVNSGGVRIDVGGDQAGDMYYRLPTTGFLQRIPVGTASQVLIGGANPSFGAVPVPVNEIFVENVANNFFDFTVSGTGKDKDGNNITFTFPSNPKLVGVYLNGQRLMITGTATIRDYTIDTVNHTLTLTEAIIASDQLYIIKYA